MDCLFCKILNNEIPSEEVFSNGKVYAFKDINPLAQTHLLFIHRTHSHDVNEMTSKDPQQIVDVFSAIRDYTESSDLSEAGFRVFTNKGEGGGQTVFHTHFHVLSDSKIGLKGVR